MAIRKLVDSDHAVLREKADPIKKISDPIKQLLDDMVETMVHLNGLGLAAPQLGISRQLVVVKAGEGEFLKLVNPQIVDSSGEDVDVEGCLSLPGAFGEVKRADNIFVEALNPGGEHINFNASGMLARIIQHEVDHLQGVLFVDRAIRIIDPEELQQKGDNA